MATLTLEEHSIGILSILISKAKLCQAREDALVIILRIKEFVDGCIGEHVRFAPDLFAELCHSFTNLLILCEQPIKGIRTLLVAIQKIQLHPAQLTSIHADVCLLALKAKCVKPVIPLLDIDITDISRENNRFDVKYFLLYYYYGGMIYATVKRLDRSLYFFEAALTTHSMAISHIMMEAYKKYILISLILHGKLQQLPKYTPQVVNRFIRPFSQPYIDLALAYNTNNPDEVRAVITKHGEVFRREKNEGLVKQVLQSLHKKNIQRLTKTFVTLSLSDVASRVFLPGPAEAENLVVRMIEDGEIFAAVNQKDGMVVFLDNPEKYNSAKMFKKLEEQVSQLCDLCQPHYLFILHTNYVSFIFIQMKLCMAADEQLRKMDQEIAVNPKYIQKLRVTEND